MEEVAVDNQYIQTYGGRQGIWLYLGNDYISKVAEKYQVSEGEIRELNNLSKAAQRFPKADYYFIPFSQNYLGWLESAGIKRFQVTCRRQEYLWPIQGSRITSRLGNRWGRHHDGIDIAAPKGTLVVSAAHGTVQFSGYDGAYGISVVVQHEDETTVSRYGHLSVAFVKKGDIVRKGQVLGLSGNTGRSTGPHLHFEVRSGGMILDPEMFLPLFQDYMESALEFEASLRQTLSNN
ncbi:MAG: M23 family metallopeptidase [Leptospiraceae bacterium]|nr:M23 family metallopeptidase [Leptospiraceae bacterium]